MTAQSVDVQLDAVEHAIWTGLQDHLQQRWDALRSDRASKATLFSRIGCAILGHSRTEHPSASALVQKCAPFCWTCGKNLEAP